MNGSRVIPFDADRAGKTGTAEWAEVNENIQVGCTNRCLYCYAAYKAATMYGGWCKREDWGNERLTKRADMKSYPARGGVVMFPSTHDITPFNIAAYSRVARLILGKGNQLLIVSKPRLDCITRLVKDLAPWREQILFRFTIGSLDNDVSLFWEPGAPLPAERIDCLELAKAERFRTSVSIEPMLEGIDGTGNVVAAVRGHVTDTIWIGKMNKAHLRVPEGHEAAVDRIVEMQCDENILRLYVEHKEDPLVRWKDSVQQVLARARV